ncbi:MAG: hypothetical protein ACREH8_23075 [Opitutaceae bacterium]
MNIPAGFARFRVLAITLPAMSYSPAEKKALGRIAFELRGHAVERSSDTRASQKGHIVFWKLKKDGWWTVRCCGVHLTLPGCYRFTNRGIDRVPKSIWPLPVEEPPEGKNMEVTIHESELTRDFITLMVEIACEVRREIPHAAFERGVVHGGGCWSIKASAHAQALQRKRRPKSAGEATSTSEK